MKIFLESLKESFKCIILKWWFVLGTLPKVVLGIIVTILGFIIMIVTGSDAYSYLNYDFVDTATNVTFFPRSLEPRIQVQWFLIKTTAIFSVFLLSCLFITFPLKSKNPEKRRELLYAGISFFLVNFVVVLISTLIQLIVKNERVSADILSILQTFLIPFSLGNFILLSAISNINESR